MGGYQRREDLEIIGDTLYVVITEGPRDVAANLDTEDLEFTRELYEGRVIAINRDTLMVTNFV